MAGTGKKVRVKQVESPEKASKVEFVTGVLALLGAGERPISVDELALGCHRISPSTFSWPEYSWLPNLDNVRVTLVDVGRAGVAETLTEGRHRQKMWRLTRKGRDWARENQPFLTALRSRLPNPELISSQSNSDLVAVAALVAGDVGSRQPIPRERLIAEAYRLFPSKFGLQQYPGWPDAAAVDDALTAGTSFLVVDGRVQLAARETKRIAALRRALHAGSGSWSGSHRRQKEGTAHKAIAQVESSPLYNRYIRDGEKAVIREGDVSALLSLTLEASPELIQARFGMLEGLLEQQERWDLVRFLQWIHTWCESRAWRLVDESESDDD